MPLTIEERSREIAVNERGFIVLGEHVLPPREAAILAYGLIDACERSINRVQMQAPGYNDSRWILQRMQSPLGVAKAAIAKLF